MGERKIAPIIFLFAIVLLFLLGVARLLVVRFREEGAYPVYSSYRCDPYGSMAFYESIGSLPGVTCLRNTEPLSKRDDMNGATLFLIGLKEQTFAASDPSLVEGLEKAARAGGRIVVALDSEKDGPSSNTASGQESVDKLPKDQVKADEKGVDKAEQGLNVSRTVVDLRNRWGLTFLRLPTSQGEAKLSPEDEELSPSLDWRGVLAFDPEESSWRVIYARDGKAVVMERKLGEGEIVLTSDSFFLTNEAMKELRHSQLLAWLCGSHVRVIFDETHLGLAASPGIVALLKKHGLAPFFAALIGLAALAIWRQSVAFVPPFRQEEPEIMVSDSTYSSGMASLFHRNIPPGELLAACFDEWRRTAARDPKRFASLTSEIEGIIAEDRGRPGKKRRPAQTYNRISELVTTRLRGERQYRTAERRSHG